MRRFGGFKFGAKTPLYLLTATGFAAFTYHSYNSINTNDFPHGHSFVNGVARSSRALFAITSCVVDYKYTLHGLPAGSDEYGCTLSEIHLRSARRILKLCDANRGFYVKAGQFVAAVRQVPTEYSSTLSSLQDKAVPCSFEAAKEVIVKSLGKELSEIFLSFDEQPVAAASIAQVHRAVLKDHQEVAVKIQYPGLEYQMKFDLATMTFLSRSVALLFPEYRFEWMVSEFTKTIACELDFIQEAKNSERAANNFKKNRMVKIPSVYWDFTSRQVLTMQFCEGKKMPNSQITGKPSFSVGDFISDGELLVVWHMFVETPKVDDLEFLKQMGISPFEVAKTLIDVFAEMIFVHGFLHGDPHPGNILVSPQGPNGFSLVILDHGIYKQLSEDFRKNYCQLWEALIRLDSQKIQQLGETFGVGAYARYFPVIFTGRTINSKTGLGKTMSLEEKRHLKEELKSLKMEDVSSFMESLPPDFLTILRTDGLLRSLISKLGASQRIRLLTYARCALRGLSSEPSSGSDSAVYAFSRFKTSINYIQLRLLLEIMEFAAYMNEIRVKVTTKLRRIMSSTRDHILTNYRAYIFFT